ncbi:hypothetical protein VTK73DRAFT_8194 [Phialemonium thermophilum]|uniref:Uncharacterized protein n=1 Tax=Phialemonium thermophilum TaxID=223376 RepID=A0ABR3XR59_9PEZI
MLFSLALWFAANAVTQGQETGKHPEWDRWCGKVYMPGFPAFDPGGQTVLPPSAPGQPLLNVHFVPRYSLYLEGEHEAEFIVNAALSPYFGQHPWPAEGEKGNGQSVFDFSIRLASDNNTLVESHVMVNSTDNIFRFDLSRLTPSLEPIPVVLDGAPRHGSSNPSWTAQSDVVYLPDKPNGTVTKIDKLNGGLLFRSRATDRNFTSFFPYGFYSSYDGFLGNVTLTNTSVLQRYAEWGFNAMTPLTNYQDAPDVFAVLDRMDMRFMFDLREYYKNLTMVQEQVLLARDAEAIFAYWSADEPDGWQDPFEDPVLAHDLIRKLDPYHPVAVVLNCQDYYFKEYTAGADIIMEDVYPIGINSTWSKWGTACNATLGDCGCDDCSGAAGVLNVPARLDILASHERDANLWPPKTKVHNPQSFHGEDYWSRDPTPAEEAAMVLLAVNHDARAIISWVYPDSDVLSRLHGRLAKVLTASPAADFLVGATRPVRARVTVGGHPDETVDADTGEQLNFVDAAYWVVGDRALVSVVQASNSDIDEQVVVRVPRAFRIVSVLWEGPSAEDTSGDGKAPSLGWWVKCNGLLAVKGLPAVTTSLFIIDLKKHLTQNL